MEVLKKAIELFCLKEYEDTDSLDFSDMKKVVFAATNPENHENIDVELACNFEDASLNMYVNGVLADSWQYDSLDDLAREIRHCRYDDLVSYGPNTEALIAKAIEEEQRQCEKAFLDSDRDGYAIFQLKDDEFLQDLFFEHYSALETDALKLRQEAHSILSVYEGVIYSSKENIENMLCKLDYNVVECSDPGMITIMSRLRITASLVLKYGVNCCWLDGSDTRGCDHICNRENYAFLYAGELDCSEEKETVYILENLFARFNVAIPNDFDGHSLSVSDVIALKINGVTTYYYVDSMGFKKLDLF